MQRQTPSPLIETSIEWFYKKAKQISPTQAGNGFWETWGWGAITWVYKIWSAVQIKTSSSCPKRSVKGQSICTCGVLFLNLWMKSPHYGLTIWIKCSTAFNSFIFVYFSRHFEKYIFVILVWSAFRKERTMNTRLLSYKQPFNPAIMTFQGWRLVFITGWGNKHYSPWVWLRFISFYLLISVISLSCVYSKQTQGKFWRS